MLRALAIRDIVLIDRLDLEFGPGLYVLTGETGSGKSILLDALGFVLGGRGDGGLLRQGASKGQVTAVFEIQPGTPLSQFLAAQDLPFDFEDSLILRRVQMPDGRTRAFVNDQPTSVTLLRQIGRALVEIHGQHEERAFMDSSVHQRLLDAFGGITAQAETVRTLYADLQSAQKEARMLLERRMQAVQEQSFLEKAVEELALLAPSPDEETLLVEKRSRLRNLEKMLGELAQALELLRGNASPLAELAGLFKRLSRMAAQNPELCTRVADKVGQALDILEESAEQLEFLIQEAAFDSSLLEETEARLFALRALARKHQVPVSALPDLKEKMDSALAELVHLEALCQAAEVRCKERKAAYHTAAHALSQARREAALCLESRIAAELPALKLPHAHFYVELQSDTERYSAEGYDQSSFWVRTNPNTAPGPLMKIASGGELSRFLLALKLVLAEAESAPTLIFDESDAGVGGAVAEAIGQRLRRLSERVQVLCVTHAAQVAAWAGTHFLIRKEPLSACPGQEALVTRIHAMTEQERQEEIARMLAGATITDQARAAAAQLLAQSQKFCDISP